MHPLTMFPQLLTYGLVGPALLRVFIGGYLLFRGKLRFAKLYKWTSILYVLAGIFLILGFYTQIAAILGFFLMGFDDWADKKAGQLSREQMILHTLCAIILITLLFTGPGFFAFDLPL